MKATSDIVAMAVSLISTHRLSGGVHSALAGLLSHLRVGDSGAVARDKVDWGAAWECARTLLCRVSGACIEDAETVQAIRALYAAYHLALIDVRVREGCPLTIDNIEAIQRRLAQIDDITLHNARLGDGGWYSANPAGDAAASEEALHLKALLKEGAGITC